MLGSSHAPGTMPLYKARLLADGTAALKELGIQGWTVGHLKVVENTDQVHNLVVCTLCSCYPIAVLGFYRHPWYKKEAYRSRAVREAPRRSGGIPALTYRMRSS